MPTPPRRLADPNPLACGPICVSLVHHKPHHILLEILMARLISVSIAWLASLFVVGIRSLPAWYRDRPGFYRSIWHECSQLEIRYFLQFVSKLNTIATATLVEHDGMRPEFGELIRIDALEPDIWNVPFRVQTKCHAFLPRPIAKKQKRSMQVTRPGREC